MDQTCRHKTTESTTPDAERAVDVDVTAEMTSAVPDTELWRCEQQPVISSSAWWLSSAVSRREEARAEEVEERRSAWAEA